MGAIAIQGRHSTGDIGDQTVHIQWVESFILAISCNGHDFEYIQDNSKLTSDFSKAMNFTGNTDGDTVVQHKLSTPYFARYVRYYPVQWVNHISLRWEVYTC